MSSIRTTDPGERKRWTGKLAVFWIGCLLATVLRAGPPLAIDFAQPAGTIRALHGVNLGPLCYRGMVDLSSYHRELSPPLTRLHDVVWVNYDAVDVSTIFRDFRDDPADPANYDFAATDDYLAAIVKVGSPILYRLGESIEHTPRKYRVHPPQDPARWADVCCQIIRHYNEGWAGGHHHQIRYWEIWNEPENQPAMWTGTDAQYFALYEVTARAIKSRWPELKVGGPSLGYTGEFENGGFKPGEFLQRFLRHCRERNVPLDFFSWHRYAEDPADFARRAWALRRCLDEHGFVATESHLNEWNFLPRGDWTPMMQQGQGTKRERWTEEMRGPRGAAFLAWALISLQDAPVDMANFYTAEIQAFGLFNFHGVPQKTFYALRAFRLLLDTPRRVRTPACVQGQPALGAGVSEDGSSVAILVSSFHGTEPLPELAMAALPWTGPSAFEVHVVDAKRDLELAMHGELRGDGRLDLSSLNSPAVALIKLRPAASPSR